MTKVLPQYWDLLKDKRFLLPALSSGLTMGAMFTYISASSELLMDAYGMSESTFSLIFSANAGGYIVFTQFNQLFNKHFSIMQVIRFGVCVQVAAATCLMTLGLIWGQQTWLPLVLASLFLCITMLGIIQPNIGVITLAYQKHRAGLASAMQGALMFSVGIFGGFLLNLFPFNPLAKLGVTMAMLTFLGSLLIWKIDPQLDLSKID